MTRAGGLLSGPRIFLLLAALLGPPGLQAREGGFSFSIGATASLAAWEEVLVQETELDVALAQGPWSGALHLPLRFRLAAMDGGPARPGFREADYDEAGDVLRLIDSLAFIDPDLGLSVRVGSVSDVTLGRGEIVRGLTNNLNIDRPETGVHARYVAERFALETVATSLLTAPVLGAWGWLCPLAPLGGVLGRLEVDAAWAADTRAPGRLIVDTQGARASGFEATTAYTGGVALPFPSKRVDTTPYLSLAGLDLEGGGTHLGVEVEVRPERDIEVTLGAEWRVTWGGYLPTYFGLAYPLDRERYVADAPKLAAVLGATGAGDGHGFAALTRVGERDRWSLELRFSERQGPANTEGSARVSANLPMGIEGAGLIAHDAADGASELFKASRALAMAEVRVPLVAHLSARVIYLRAMRDAPDGRPQLFSRGMLGVSVFGEW